MAVPVQAKAVFFILLLVGHEAARVKNTVQHLKSEKPDGPTAEWQQENAACTWSSRNWACLGSNASATEEKCAFRYLPYDVLPPLSSESCRLRDDYMLENNRAQYFQLQAKLLKVKSEKFSRKCASASAFNLKCNRRAKHVFRAINFMSKAQDASFMASLTDVQKRENRALFQESLEHMTSFVGPDAVFVQMLKQKMITNEEAVKRNPLKSVQEVVKLLTMLLQGSDEEKEAARKAIQDLSPAEGEDQKVDLPEFTHTLDSRFAEIKDGLNSEVGELDDELHESADVMQTLATNRNSTALLEMSDVALRNHGETFVKGIAFVVTVFLVVVVIVWILDILAIMVAWAVLSVVGCGAYAAGNNYAVSKNDLPSDQRLGVLGTMKCIAKVFTLPFLATYKGGKAISRAFRPKKQISSPPPTAQARQ